MLNGLVAWWARNPVAGNLLMVFAVVAGIFSFFKLGRAEDPSFSIKVMTLTAAWPGATAQEMQDLVAEPLEKRLQELRWYEKAETFTRQGLMFTTLTLKDLNGYTIGAEIPVSAAATLGVNYTPVKYKGTNGTTLTLGKAALVGRYALSKNTFLYTGISTSTGDLKDYVAEKTVTQLGMRTAF